MSNTASWERFNPEHQQEAAFQHPPSQHQTTGQGADYLQVVFVKMIST